MNFWKIPAGEIMTTPVVRVMATDKIDDAALLMSNHKINAVPVLCESGICVGVLSGQDLIEYESIRKHAKNEFEHMDVGEIARMGIENVPSISKIRFDQVEHHMNRNFVIANPLNTIVELTEQLCESHSHHAIIMDEESNLTGIVSTLDILSCGLKNAKTV